MAESSIPPPSLPPTDPSSRPSRPGPIYQPNSQARIDEILEIARQRRQVMGPGSSSPAQPLSPTQSARLSEREGEGADSSADELTSIVRGPGGKRNNYQSTASSSLAAGSTGPVKRRLSARGHRPQQQHPASDASDTDDQQPWWRKQVEKIGSIELENKGSVARDHLALERTFLAWLRTSLAFASIGIAITQLFRLNTTISNSGAANDPYYRLRQTGKPLGATFLGISILVLFVGFHRYFESQHWIIRGKFPASRGSVAFVAAIALALMVTSLVVVIVVEPSSFEK